MPINYWSIFKQAFHVTSRYPGLWLLGLFLSGGFNANFFYWANLRLGWRDRGAGLWFWLSDDISVRTAAAVAGFLLVGIILFVAANWAKVLFILRTSDILKLQRMRPQSEQTIVQESPRYLASVITMSVFTVVSVTVVTIVLGGSPQWLFSSDSSVWLLAAVLYLALVFFFSYVNVFGTFFIIFYRRSFSSAFNLAFDLIFSRWRVILEMTVLLMVVYGLCFFVGTALLSVITIPLLGGLVLWLWLAIVNTFFNVSLLLLFARLVQPPYHPEFKSLLANMPVAAAGPAAYRVDNSRQL